MNSFFPSINYVLFYSDHEYFLRFVQDIWLSYYFVCLIIYSCLLFYWGAHTDTHLHICWSCFRDDFFSCTETLKVTFKLHTQTQYQLGIIFVEEFFRCRHTLCICKGSYTIVAFFQLHTHTHLNFSRTHSNFVEDFFRCTHTLCI
jgi:hypothetical protein